MGVRMRDVAERAGVSVATVSYVLTGRKDKVISDATRERVRTAASQLNYRYNALAGDLRRGRTTIVGVQIYSFTVQTWATMLTALEERLRAAGLQPLLCHVTNAEAQRLFHKECRDRRVSGLVLTGPLIGGDLRYLEDLMEAGRVVVSALPVAEPEMPCVTIDREGGAGTAARHFLSLGHRHLAAVTGWVGQALRDLGAGFRAAHAEAGLPFAPENLIRVACDDNFYAIGDRAVERLLELPRLPTAVLATDDEIAIGVMRSLQRRGMRVPQDVALIGWDDVPAAAYADVPLTTMAYPARDQGTQLAQLFLEGLPDPRPIAGREIRLPLPLVVRKSCGATLGNRSDPPGGSS